FHFVRRQQARRNEEDYCAESSSAWCKQCRGVRAAAGRTKVAVPAGEAARVSRGRVVDGTSHGCGPAQHLLSPSLSSAPSGGEGVRRTGEEAACIRPASG